MRHQAANTLTMINKKQHGRRRRIVSRAVSNTAMREHEPTILYHIKKLLDAVSQTDDEGLGLVETIKDYEEGWSRTRNMTHWCNYLTFDIMGDVIFGVKLNLLDNFANRYIVSAIENSNVRVSVLIQSPILGTKWMGRLDRYLFPKAIAARGHFLKFVSGLVNHTMKLDCSPAARTVFSVLTTSSDPETGDTLSARELMAESTTLCVAGSDTSSTALAALFFYLARNPRIYDRAAQEIRSAFKSKDEIRMGATLNSLTYLRACIDEALRMSPPAGSSLYREVMDGGATVCGQYFPAGVEIGVPIYGIHHNPKYFPAPHTYRPERWIVGEGGSTQQSVELAQSAHIPFSVGPRSCVGKIMALTELMLGGALALYTLDFRMEEGDSNGGRWGADKGFDEPGEYVLHDHITASKNGPMIQFRQRKVE
jgi:cytochrome P450